MNRKELYAKVIDLNLKETVKKMYGDNYTRVSNADLEAVVIKAMDKAKKVKPVPKPKPFVARPTTGNAACKSSKDKLTKLVELLQKKHILLASEVAYINS